MLGGNLRESGSEFQRTLLQYTRLEKVSPRDWYIDFFSDCPDWFRENLAIREGGTLPHIILCVTGPAARSSF